MVALDAEVGRRAQAAARTLARYGTLRAVYVFGSHAEGRADSWSDIDLGAFMDEVETWDIQKRASVMASVMQEAGSNVEAHLFPVSAFENPEPGSFAAYILRHGIRVWQEDARA